jgi:hypothetical protein
MRPIHGFAVLLLMASQAQANYSGNRCVERFNGYVKSKCPGHTLPADRLRNFDFGSHQIECSANSDSYIRRPQKYDFLKWSDLRATMKKQEAFDLRRSLPEVRWSGQIPYQTVEVWHWQYCALGTSAIHCGTHTVCENVTRQECSTTGSGNDARTTCHDVTERVCHEEPNSCHYDHDAYEAVHCSNESMKYDAHYVRPSPDQWNAKSHPYAEFLPNKYDLMPGELEVIQTYNNNRRGPRLNPYTAIGDAWNKYTFTISGSGAGAMCVPHNNYSIDVAINTVERDTSKATPNAFRLPVDETGKPMSPISNWRSSGKVIKGQPTAIMLDDSAAAVVKALAEHSQENAEREMAKAEAGKISNADGLSSQEADAQGFFKNTVVKIRLLKNNRYWLNRRLGWDIYNNDVKSVRTSNNILSKDQEIMLSDKWEIDLLKSNTKANGKGKTIDLYLQDNFHLQANRVYTLQVSMYQRGVPFYKKDCEMDPRFACTWPWPVGRSEDSYFSKPMEVRFETSPDLKQRSFSNFMNDGGIGPVNLLRKIFEPLVAEPTRGENK